jgi:hypothetical protein
VGVEGVEVSIRGLIAGPVVRVVRQILGHFIWTHPSIAQTFHCRPGYEASFKKAWLSLLWGGEIDKRELRESIAVAISVANKCRY